MTIVVSSARHERPATGRGARVPKYYRVKQHVLELTEALVPGSRMPAERLLALRFDTSRTTVRLALQELASEGRLDRVHGKGTFVARPKLRRTLRLTSCTEELRAQGLRPATRILDIGERDPDARLTRLLGLGPGERVLRLERLRLADGVPTAIETTHLPAHRFPDLHRSLAAHGSLYTALAKDHGVRPAEAEETIETAVATPREAELLATDVGLPMLLLSRHSHDDDGLPLEWTRSVHPGSRHTFTVPLTRPRR
ncbi:GntR family transcriptional regulator [Streptomyces sp. NPDC056160]|uniref:GntR family transcriptional regulator n=1 Tax=Streptomyces sp. NPDC056160 TaxID=3345731 RepID=UPI0035E178E3